MAAPIVSGIAALVRTRFPDRDNFSSRFIMGQIATTGPLLLGKCYPRLYLHSADALASLATSPHPSLSFVEFYQWDTSLQSTNNDNDGRVDSGETIDLGIVIRNHWGKAENVTVRLDAWAEGAFQPDPYVSVLTNTVDYGAIGSFNRDDNGLIFDLQNGLTGVRHPFRFCVSPTCPNDHVIPFRLTMTCRNGLDPQDPTTYSFQDRFDVVVTHGRELPRLIEQDMTLSKDFYWIVPQPTLVATGVTVTVTEGAQVQFSYGSYLQVEGTVTVRGTQDEPVELFPGGGWSADIFTWGSGTMTEIRYARIMNPYIMSTPLFDHCYFEGGGPPPPDRSCSLGAQISGLVLNSIFKRVNPSDCMRSLGGFTCLFDTCSGEAGSGENSVFLGCHIGRGGGLNWNASAGLDGPVYQVRGACVWSNKTYFPVIRGNQVAHDDDLQQAEQFARRSGGHVADITDANEDAFVRSFTAATDPRYAPQGIFPVGWGIIGLQHGPNGWGWTSGEPLAYYPSSASFMSMTGGLQMVSSDAWAPVYPAERDFGQNLYYPFIVEVPGARSYSEILTNLDGEQLVYLSPYKNNAYLFNWFPGKENGMSFPVSVTPNRNERLFIGGNFWGTTSSNLIQSVVYDYNNDFNCGRSYIQPIRTPTNAPVTCYPFVTDVVFSTPGAYNTIVVGAERVTFTVSFNRDMDTSRPLQVSFGPDAPVTDYTVHPINGGWQSPRAWVGFFDINPLTGDGYQYIRVAGAVAADDHWFVTGDDSGRYRFEVITSGTEAMNLQANGAEGRVDLSWMQDDFELLAGYNVYRSVGNTNSFVRINAGLIPRDQRAFTDTNVQPAQTYFYRFTVVKSDMGESNPSNIASATTLDTIPPVIVHTPVTSAQPGLPLTLFADVTDNVGVQGVTLYFRAVGQTDYLSRAMTRISGNRYAATIEASRLVSPGLEYYIEATDGVSTVRSVSPVFPHVVSVVDRPVVTAVSPVSGPVAGGTSVTVAGANFRTNATVSFGGVAASLVVWVNGSQITCVTPAHFPAAVDVAVTNPDGQSGTFLRGYTYLSDTVAVALPNTGGAQYDLVSVPLGAGNIQGLAAADITVTFDSNVLRGLGAHTGALTPGWGLAANTNTPGQIRLSMASPSGTVSGAGSLALLDFEVIGAPGSNGPLHLAAISLNDGAILVSTNDGSFAVAPVYRVSGAVTFWKTGAGVPRVLQTLSGDRVFTGASGTNGAYTMPGALAGAYTLTPSKSDDVNGITAYDASLVLQHAASLTNLTGSAAIAADVNKNGVINAMDAFYILQNSVGLLQLPFPGAGVVWDFAPASRAFSSLNSDQSGQDFTAILLGDVSGNWADSAPGPGGLIHSLDLKGPIVLGMKPFQPAGSNTGQMWLLINTGDAEVYSLDLKLSYDPSSAQVLGLGAAPFVRTMALASNTNQPGVIQAALAAAVPLKGIGAVLVLALTNQASAPLRLVSASVNEGSLPVKIDSTGAVFDQDTDGDGVSDWNEILAGTDPADKKSFLHILHAEQLGPVAGGGRKITWASVPGKKYRLLCCDQLSARAWQPVGSDLVATGDTTSQTDGSASGATQRYYRVQVVN